MRLIGNIIWLIFGGFETAIAWFFCGLVSLISIVGIPWARSCFTIGLLALWPFGKSTMRRDDLYLQGDVGTSALGTIGNIIWFILAGWWLALMHLVIGVVLCITIIGIPFGIQHFKLAKLALLPVGVDVVDSDIADLAKNMSAADKLELMRRYR